jgi:hypothetical protein
MVRRIVDLHPEAIVEGREARKWYRERSHDVEHRRRVETLEVLFFSTRLLRNDLSELPVKADLHKAR